MGYGLNRISKELRQSINSPDYDDAPEWLAAFKNDPNVATMDSLLAAGVPTRYWAIDQPGDVVREMTPAEKAAVDANEAAQLPAIVAQARETLVTQEIDQVESIERAAALALLDGYNLHSSKMVEILNAVDAATSLADLKARFAAIQDPINVTPAQLRNAIRNKLGA